jgi:predicted RNase H-like nuclease
VRIFGVDLGRERAAAEPGESTLVLLDDAGHVAAVRHPATLPAVVEAVHELSSGEPFLLGVNTPVVVRARAGRSRAVENLIRRRFGHRLRSGGRAAAAERPAVVGESLLAGLAAAGHPCLPYPDRDRRTSGLAEIHPDLSLKALLWEASAISHAGGNDSRDEMFRALAAPAYRAADSTKRATWADRVTALDLIVRALGPIDGYDFRHSREALIVAQSDADAERAASLFDAALVAGTARRYLLAPEACLFLGDRENGYVILPADGFVRRLALRDTRPPRGELFPRGSLRDRLGDDAELRTTELLTMEGRPERLEASFRTPPFYEFDNLDEMLWWKHCRHLDGPLLPTEGLQELTVQLGADNEEKGGPLRLARSRHRTLSFRFDPPAQWRTRLPTRDGKTYPFRVLRAVYDTLPGDAAAR